MHPAYSVILFTTSSGAGYGLLFWLSLAHGFGRDPLSGLAFVAALFVALGLITIGLLSSTLHLGHPERAWRALSQWRSSWLSREGVAAIATYVPAGLLFLIALTGTETGWSRPLALASAAGAGITVYTTGMIYASLKTIRQWNLPLVPMIYLALAAASGATLLSAMTALSGTMPGWVPLLALATSLVALGLKHTYYRTIDADPGRFTIKDALGFGETRVRQLDPPHTRPNFVMREMGYEVARKHATRLRLIVMAALFAAPILLMLVIVATGSLPALWSVLAVLVMGFGLVVERWLFFAEAVHVSMLFYGRQQA